MGDRRRPRVAGHSFSYEYVTSAVNLLNGDGIGIHVVNDSSAEQNTGHYLQQHWRRRFNCADSSSLVVTPSGTGAWVIQCPENG